MINYTSAELAKMDVVSNKYMSDLLHNIRNETFAFQKELQSDNIIIEKAKVHIRDFTSKLRPSENKHVASYRNTCYVDYQFINTQRKLSLKRSGLLGQEVSIYDISKNYQVFDKNFMAFIDGELVDCIDVLVRDSGVEFVLNFKKYGIGEGVSESVYKDWMKRNVPIDIIFFSNSFFNPLVVDRKTLYENRNNISQINKSFIDSLSNSHSYLTFVKTFERGMSVNLTHSPDKDTLLDFFKSSNKVNNEKAFINLYGFKNLAQTINVSNTEKLIQIPGFKMPIPPENLLVFIRSANGFMYTSNVKIELKYPNFYEIDNPTGMNLSILVFYSPENKDYIGYYDALKPYRKVMGDDLIAHILSPEDVKNFKPTNMKFSIREFMKGNEEDALYYKLEKLNNIAESDPEFLRKFFKDRFENIDGYYINMSNIDLSKRIRTTNELEVGDSHYPTTFTEDHYLITLKDPFEEGSYEISMYIDGIHYNIENVYTKGYYTYVYIPVKLINKDSIIEVERTRVERSSEKLTVFSTVGQTVNLKVRPGKLAIDDFDVINLRDNTLVDKNNFKFTTSYTDVYNRDEYEVMHTDTITMKCINPDIVGVPLKIIYGRDLYTKVVTVNTATHLLETTLDTKGVIENDKIRVFINGRLIPNYHHEVHGALVDYKTKIRLKFNVNVGDIVTFECTPNAYSNVLDMSDIPNNGIINLVGFISRPFDLGWYDIFVNGRKLTKHNIEYVSPFIIKLKNLKSLNNLLICDRGRPTDIIGIDPNNKGNIVDKLWNEDVRFQDALIGENKNINPIEDDILSEQIYWFWEQLKDFFTNEVQEGLQDYYHLNPDLQDITKEVSDKYPLLFRDPLGVLHFNPDLNVNSNDVIIHVNPDRYGMTSYEEELVEFFEMFMKSTGLHINPDNNQITDEMRERLPNLLGVDSGVILNPDVKFNDQVPLMYINPDL